MKSTPNSAVAPVMRSATVGCGVDEAFRIFTDEIGAWWPLPTHGLFGAEAGGVVFRDDMLIELATDGRESVWAEVVEWSPPTRLALAWHPGREADEATVVEVSFVADGPVTRVVVEHHGWERFGVDARSRRRTYDGPNAWGYVLDHFTDGATPREDSAELSLLDEAYARLFDEFERGGFLDPPAGEWSAEQVLAHVALNDTAMVAACQSLVHGGEPRFENATCQETSVLDSWIAAGVDHAGMLARARQCSRQLRAALARLSPEQLAVEVRCRLHHDGELVLDGARRWGSIAVDVQAEMHLPAHTEQLRNLRP